MCDATVECNQSAKNMIDQVAEKSLQSKTKPYNKNQCIICQKEEGRLHNVETKPMGERMLNVAKELNDESLFIWLNNIATCTDAVANDVK